MAWPFHYFAGDQYEFDRVYITPLKGNDGTDPLLIYILH